MKRNTDISPKVAGASVGGALAVIVMYVLHTVWGITPPAEVGGALAFLLSTVGGWVSRDVMRDKGTGNVEPDLAPVEESN